MNQRIRCWQCGKAAVVTPQDAGQRTVCAACGAIQDFSEGAAGNQLSGTQKMAAMWGSLPDVAAPADDSAEAAERLAGAIPPRPTLLGPVSSNATVDLRKDELAEAVKGAGNPSAAPSTEPEGEDGPLPVFAMLLGAMSVIVLLVVAIVLFTTDDGPSDWEVANRSKIIALKEQAEAFEKDGDLQSAKDTYDHLADFVGKRALSDAELALQVEAAGHARQRLDAAMAVTKAEEQGELAAASPGDRERTRLLDSGDGDSFMNRRPEVTLVAPGGEVGTEADATGTAPVPFFPRFRPPVVPQTMPAEIVTDEQIAVAIRNAADLLKFQFENGALRAETKGTDSSFNAGLAGLAVYSLLAAGDALDDPNLRPEAPAMKEMLDKLRDMQFGGGFDTYARGFRLVALSFHNRAEDRNTIRNDLDWMLRSHIRGAYYYNNSDPKNRPIAWDNSNTHIAVLGVWAAAEAGYEVPGSYWAVVQNHWAETQHEDGQWSYQPKQFDPRPSMTMAGLATLFVTHDFFEAPRFGAASASSPLAKMPGASTTQSARPDADGSGPNSVGRRPLSDPLLRGLSWLEQDNNSVNFKFEDDYSGYALFALERVGLASGFKYFGEHDWFRILSGILVLHQSHDGSFSAMNAFRQPTGERHGDNTPITPRVLGSNDVYNTAFRLIFLARGRHPLLLNKLRYPGAWANRPRDAANLARYTARTLERGLNWQIVSLERDYHDWLDAPILYLSNHVRPSILEADLQKLRQYVEAGGMLLTHADGGGSAMNAWAEEMALKLFNRPLADLPDDHEFWTAFAHVDRKPNFKYISNGSRILMMHSTQDIAQAWQLRTEKSRRNIFDTGLNLFLWTTGKTHLRHRLSSLWIPPVETTPPFIIRVARLQHGSGSNEWNPEPFAWTRFSRWFYYQTGYGLGIEEMTPAQLDPKRARVAHLTGTMAYSPSTAEIEAIRGYVQGGGVLLVDACGGSSTFAGAAREMVEKQVFPGSTFEAVAAEHPLRSGRIEGGVRLATLPLRPYAEEKLGQKQADLFVLSAGQGQVVFTPQDLSTGLLGTHTWGIVGHRPDGAQALVKNVILWAADGAPDASLLPTTAPATTMPAKP